ncbi:MAG: hypothetical protein IRY95_05750 [Clostridia bacterium]|nr:hypothetical protein [Clostridia bacterium]
MGQLPRGKVKLPKGDFFEHIDSPRGEVGCYIYSDGGVRPYRIHWRSPSFIHLQLLPYLCRGHKVADLVVILATLDPVMGEVDR